MKVGKGSFVDHEQTFVVEEYFYRSKSGAEQRPDIERLYMSRMLSSRNKMSYKCDFKLSSCHIKTTHSK